MKHEVCPLCHRCSGPGGVYEKMCRPLRHRMFPDIFERWTSEEHLDKKSSLTFSEQERLWLEIDAWEDYLDGKMSLEDTHQFVADLGPLPKVSMKIKRIANNKKELTNV